MSIAVAREYVQTLKLKQQEREEVENVIAGYIADCEAKDKRIDELMQLNLGLAQESHKLQVGIQCIRNLINDSAGVIGLHQNGELATWDELERGGAYQDWLWDFNEAEQI